ncbi:MAG: hypothetical protein ACRDYZ_09930, partial [Acidimicrobiales bacterium]
LAVIANAWDPGDVLSGETPLGPGDAYLGENDVLDAGKWEPASRYRAKLEAMRAYRTRHHVALFATATLARRRRASAVAVAARVVALLAPFELDAVAVTDPLYSARDNRLAPPVA